MDTAISDRLFFTLTDFNLNEGFEQENLIRLLLKNKSLGINGILLGLQKENISGRYIIFFIIRPWWTILLH